LSGEGAADPAGEAGKALPPFVFFDDIDSTNEEARRRLGADGVRPQWLIARRQSQGRGRHGRAWASLAGNLHASLLTPAPRPVMAAARLSFVAALAVVEMVKEAAGAGLGIACKWPNDVLLEGGKVAGILLEAAQDPRQRPWLIVGIGVNLAHAPPDTRWPAASLADHGIALSVDSTARMLARTWEKWRRIHDAQGFAPVRAAWMARAHGLGARVSLAGAEPGGALQGAFIGLDESGAARLRLDSGAEKLIHAGELSFPPDR
jgi:BirA family biotin operon repressor/biotin-[acetyl-CoA-carboxylase] ligase